MTTAASSRKSPSLTMDDLGGVVLGIDIGGTKVALMARDIVTGADLWRDRFSTPQPAEPDHVFTQSLVFSALEELRRQREGKDLR